MSSVFTSTTSHRIQPKPTLFAGLLNEHGHKGPGEIEPKRMYMFKDCIRGAALLGLPGLVAEHDVARARLAG